MKIAFACDHAGFPLREAIINYLKKKKHSVVDFGTFSENSCDYPDFAEKVALAVSRKKVWRGILACGTGVGMSIAANKIPGVRAAVCWNEEIARLISEHNNSNILCLSGRLSKPAEAVRWLAIWLNTRFVGGRHLRRVNKIRQLEKKYCRRKNGK